MKGESTASRAPDHSPGDLPLRWLLWLSVGFGCWARVVYFLRDRNLWYDEAAVGVNLVTRSYLGLFEPLDWAQTAPPLFLVLTRLVAELVGYGEQSLRSLSFVSGIAFLPCLFFFARQVSGWRVAAFATSLAALSPALATYSAEVKPYATDALVAPLLMGLAIRAAGGEGRKLAGLAVAGFIAVLSSTTSILVLGGVTAYLMVRTMPNRSRVVLLGLLGIAWASLFVAVVQVVHASVVSRTEGVGPFMQSYWQPYFLNVPVTQLAGRASLIYHGLVPELLVAGSAPPRSGTVLALLLAVGAALLIRRRQLPDLLLLIAPVALLAVAARLSMYPMAPRLAFVTSTSIVILLSLGIWGWGAPKHRGLTTGVRLVVSAAILALAARASAVELRQSPRTEASRELIRAVLSESSDTTPVWVSFGAGPAWDFYSGVLPGSGRVSSLQVLRAPGTEGFATLPVAEQDTRLKAWADQEVDRLVAANSGCARLLFSHTSTREVESLVAAIERRGGAVRLTGQATGAQAMRACFT